MKDIVGGTALAGLFSLCANGFHVVSSEFSYWFSIGSAVTRIPLGFSTALLGAGYLIGIASGMAILVGTLLAWYIFVPYLTSTLIPADGQSAAAFANAIWAQKVRFIGAGCIGIAAVWTLIRLAKPVVDGIKMSINALRANDTEEKKALHHTDIDMSPKSVSLVFLAILIGLFITFYAFVSNAGLSLSVTIMFIVVASLSPSSWASSSPLPAATWQPHRHVGQPDFRYRHPGYHHLVPGRPRYRLFGRRLRHTGRNAVRDSLRHLHYQRHRQHRFHFQR